MFYLTFNQVVEGDDILIKIDTTTNDQRFSDVFRWYRNETLAVIEYNKLSTNFRIELLTQKALKNAKTES